MEENNKTFCPCCNVGMIESDCFDICEVCGWEESHPDYKGGANHMSLNEAREAYKKGIQIK
jgi:hypothetical protein|nr:MAG TPA: cysteine-rich protein [Caudoviricetes sp.]